MIAYVKWVDSSHIIGWKKRRDARPMLGLAVCETVGFVVAETDEYLTLAQSLDDDKGDSQGWDAIMSIPIVCIKKRRVLKK